MAQLIDIKSVSISQRSLSATVRIADEAPLFTGDDPAGTDLIADLIPELADHACYGDGAETFGEVMGDTELAHLLEHVTVELLARTNRAGDIAAGQTRTIDDIERLYEVRLACPDDVLVAGALSSASWIIDWAYNGGGAPEPDIDAIASGLVALVDSLVEEPAEPAPAEEEAADPDATLITPLDVEPTAEPEPEPAEEPEVAEPDPEPAAEPEIAEPELEEPDVVSLDPAEEEPQEDESSLRFIR